MASLLQGMLQPAQPIQAQAPQSPQTPQAPRVQEDPSVLSKVAQGVGSAASIAALFL